MEYSIGMLTGIILSLATIYFPYKEKGDTKLRFGKK